LSCLPRPSPSPIPTATSPDSSSPHIFHQLPSTPAFHSFPTRRSSDLVFRAIEIANTLELHHAFECAIVAVGPAVVWAAMAHSKADRKSTRLNSSHQIISYAVFCLKKKSRNRDADHVRRKTADDQPGLP